MLPLRMLDANPQHQTSSRILRARKTLRPTPPRTPSLDSGPWELNPSRSGNFIQLDIPFDQPNDDRRAAGNECDKEKK